MSRRTCPRALANLPARTRPWQVAGELPTSLRIRHTAVSNSDYKFRCVTADAELTEELTYAAATATGIVHGGGGVGGDKWEWRAEGAGSGIVNVDPDGALTLMAEAYKPHTSVLYGELSDADRAKAAAAVAGANGAANLNWEASDLVLMMTTGNEHQCWVEVARAPLGMSWTPGEVPRVL